MNTKPSLRDEARARRAALAGALPDFAGTIVRFADALKLAGGVAVAGYWPTRDEADPRELMKALAALGHPLALPRIEAKGIPLAFHRWHEGDRLVENFQGIVEPVSHALLVRPRVLLMPLLAFDPSGHRLGYGGGYYDRTLAALPGDVVAVGVAYSGQEVPALPRHPHDHPLDMVVTENGVRRF